MGKRILVFGAGKSATVLIDYILENSPAYQWKLLLVDANLDAAKNKIGSSEFAEALSFDISDEEQRGKTIQQADIVISLMPPALHFLIAADWWPKKVTTIPGIIKSAGIPAMW